MAQSSREFQVPRGRLTSDMITGSTLCYSRYVRIRRLDEKIAILYCHGCVCEKLVCVVKSIRNGKRENFWINMYATATSALKLE